MTGVVAAGPPAYRLYHWAWTGIDWLFPPPCGGCTNPGARWCDTCSNQIKPITDQVCPGCGQPTGEVELCPRCRANPPAYLALRSWAVYGGPLRKAIHRLKYNADGGLGEILARSLSKKLIALGWPVEMIIPVPAGIDRQAQRGYNQTTFIAFPLALMSNLPYRPAALAKIRQNRTQVGLTVEQRRQNVKDVFQAKKSVVNNKTVLVIDDVTTSGATMEACASALKAAGAREVFGLTLARAIIGSGDMPDEVDKPET